MIEEISNINDKEQVVLYSQIHEIFTSFTQSMTINMYFAVSWLEPRLVINETAVEWEEDRTGPKNVATIFS